MPKFKKFVKTPLGFTLIELLLVIAIIGIVIAIGAASYSASQRNGRNAKRQSDLAKIASALEQYYQDHNQYPKTPDSGTTNYVAENAGNDCSSQAICCLLGGATAKNLGICKSIGDPTLDSSYKIYLTSLPFDPLSSQMSATSSYVYYSSGQFFTLVTRSYEGATTGSLADHYFTNAPPATTNPIGNPNSNRPDGGALTYNDVYNAVTGFDSATQASNNQYFVRSPKL